MPKYKVQITIRSSNFQLRSGAAAFVALSLFLLGTDGAGQAQDERASLSSRQRELTEKTARLGREQDFLLFKKEMYVTDSKYLLLRLSEKRGTLMYRNRILKDFKFTPSSAAGLKSLHEGRSVLTRKTEGSGRKYALVFGSAFSMQPKQVRTARQENKLPRLLLTKRDMAAIFYAVETGSIAYIMR